MAQPGYVWDGAEWENFTGPSQETMPAGTIAMWLKATPPTGWLLCNGQEYGTSTYPDLYANLGNAYEIGNQGPGISRVPNMMDKFVIGAVSKDKVAKQDAYQSNSLSTQQHTFVSAITLATGNTAHNHNFASFNNDHTHNTNTPTTNGDGAHNHPMNAHNPNAEGGGNVSRTAGGAGSSFSAHSHNANAPSTNGGGGHNHSLNAVSTNTANTVSHAHSTNFSTLNTHNHTVENDPVQSAAPTTTVLPPYQAVHYIIKATNG